MKKNLMYRENTSVTDETLLHTPPAKENNEFECLYLLVEAAVAVQKQEKERSKVVA